MCEDLPLSIDDAPSFAFTTTDIDLTPGTTFCFVADGVTDQIGGARRRAFARKHVARMLERIQWLLQAEQKASMQQEILTYRGEEARRECLTFGGFRPR